MAIKKCSMLSVYSNEYGKILFALSFLILLSACATSLKTAASCGDLERVQQLVEKGADVNKQFPGPDAENSTALQTAAAYGYPDVVEFLLTKGADVNATNLNGFTALHFAAAFTGRKDVVELLIQHGADVTAKDCFLRTPADIASMYKYDAFVSLLDPAKARGSEVNLRDLREEYFKQINESRKERKYRSEIRPACLRLNYLIDQMPIEMELDLQKQGKLIRCAESYNIKNLAEKQWKTVERLQTLISRKEYDSIPLCFTKGKYREYYSSLLKKDKNLLIGKLSLSRREIKRTKELFISGKVPITFRYEDGEWKIHEL